MAGVSTARGLLDEQELMRRLLAKYTLKECAALLNVTYHTVCRRARRPEFLQQLGELSKDVYSEVDSELRAMTGLMTERIVSMADVALDKLEKLLVDDSTDKRLVARVAMDILDRNNETSKTTKHIAKVEHAFMDPRLLAQAAKAAQELDESNFAPLLEGDVS
jgi:hypothetical protein